MRTIQDCIKELKTRKAWKSPEEIELIFDEIAEIDKANDAKHKKLLNAINELKQKYQSDIKPKN